MNAAGSSQRASGLFIISVLLIIGIALSAGCVFFSARELTNPNSPVPVQVVQKTPVVTTLPQTLSPTPTILFTTVPKIGSKDPVRGRVSGIDPAAYDVVVYIYVDGWWGPKPLWDKPLTPIASDGSWSCEIVTTSTDALATRIAAYALPRGVIPENRDGQQELPASMAIYQHTITDRY